MARERFLTPTVHQQAGRQLHHNRKMKDCCSRAVKCKPREVGAVQQTHWMMMWLPPRFEKNALLTTSGFTHTAPRQSSRRNDSLGPSGSHSSIVWLSPSKTTAKKKPTNECNLDATHLHALVNKTELKAHVARLAFSTGSQTNAVREDRSTTFGMRRACDGSIADNQCTQFIPLHWRTIIFLSSLESG